MKKAILFVAFLICVTAASRVIVSAQTTEFRYQGSLRNGGTVANGNYDLEFALFTSLAGGTQLGQTVSVPNVTVTNGIFAASLNFGNEFTGAGRFLEIRVRPSGGGSFTTLSPRQAITSSPYAVRSLSADSAVTASNATQLGGVAASQYVLTGDARLSDARNPLPNSSNYIQNRTTAQASSNFNISGTGNANVFNAQQFNIGGAKVLSSNASSLYLGASAGEQNTVQSLNSFIGNSAGRWNSGSFNTFVGADSGIGVQGQANTGFRNSFLGYLAGGKIRDGYDNTAVGFNAGGGNSSGHSNNFFGSSSGDELESGNENIFVGTDSAPNLITGSENVVIGNNAANLLETGERNTFVGRWAGRYPASTSDSVFVGYDAGILPGAVGTFNVVVGSGAKASSGISYGTAIGAGSLAAASNTVQLGRTDIDSVRIGRLGTGGSTAVCLNGVNGFATCSSSVRYKSNITAFSSGLDLIKKLRPVSFYWKDNNKLDLGLVAEEVADTEPLLTINNENGEVEGVKYDRIGVVLVNAVNEQQLQIEELQRRAVTQDRLIVQQNAKMRDLERELAELKALVCKAISNTARCR